jgi:hypothetical protein
MISIVAIAADPLVQAGLRGGKDSGILLVFAVVPPAAAAFIGWWGVRRATAEQRVWERGKTRFED